MIISYQGVECFKISQGDLAIVTNPKSKLAADITLFTLRQAQGKPETSEKSGFVIDGPGEYEIKDIFIKGFPNTYLINFEGMKLLFLSTKEVPEDIEDVDILFISVGSDPAAAYKLAVSLEPAVIIPMHYDGTTLVQFIKEGGEKVEPLDKFVVKKKDLEGKEGEIVVLKQE